jgi:hypothetical protein
MAAACVAAVLLGTPAMAQPDRRPDDAPRLAPRMDGEGLRARLEARLAETRREEAALQEALTAIDNGEPPPQVMRDLMRDSRERGGEDRPIDPAELTPERRAQILNFLRETTPQLADRVERELRDRPDQADRIYARLAPRVIPQIELRERDPELYGIRADSMRLDWRIRQAAITARNAPASARAESRGVLLALVRERVDLAIRERALMLDRFEKRIEGMREDLQSERDRRDEIVAEKVDELERGVADELPPPGEPGPGFGDNRGPRRDRRGPPQQD